MATDFSKYGSVNTSNTNTQTNTNTGFLKYGTPISGQPSSFNVDNNQNNYGAVSPATGKENPLEAGLKATQNLPSSALNFAKNIFSAITHPAKTAKSVINTAVGGVEKIIPGKQDQEEQFNQFISSLKDRYGSLENLQKTAINDPFGLGTDILSILEGGATLLGKSAQLNTGLSKIANNVTSPLTKVGDKIADISSKTTKFGLSQATGLNPETIKEIIQNPSQYSGESLKSTNRTALSQSVKESIDSRLENLSDIGKGYDTIRQSNATVSIPPQTVTSVLKKYGLQIVDGKIKTTSESIPLSSTDKTALEDFLSVYGNESNLSSNAFLNTREALSQLSKYDSAKSGNLEKISRDLRREYDSLGKKQIPGLAQLDSEYAPEVSILRQIKKDYLKPDGEFKDGAINKIANLTGTGKDQILERLEKIQPGVTQRIKILKAAEDIEKAAGLKVGTYLRSTGLAGGVLTGNPALIVSAIISSPEIAVKLLRSYGYTKKTIAPIVSALYKAANDVNSFRLPGSSSQYIQNYITSSDKK